MAKALKEVFNAKRALVSVLYRSHHAYPDFDALESSRPKAPKQDR